MFKLSTGLRNARLEAMAKIFAAKSGTTLSYNAAGGAGGTSQILDSGNGLGSFRVGDVATVIGSTLNNNKTGRIVTVAAGAIDVSGVTLVAESAGTAAIVASTCGGLRGILRAGVIGIYSGTQPATADAAETGTLLCLITLASGAFTPGVVTNGIDLGQTDSGIIHKATGQVWSGVNLATGIAGYARFYDNSKTTGSSTTAVRIDGSVATSGGQYTVSSTSLVEGSTTTIDVVNATEPAQ